MLGPSLHVFQSRQCGCYRLLLHRPVSWAAEEEALGQSPLWRGFSSLPQWLLPCEQLSEEAGSRVQLFQLCGCFPHPTYTVPIFTTGSNEKMPISGTRGRVELAVISLGSALCSTLSQAPTISPGLVMCLSLGEGETAASAAALVPSVACRGTTMLESVTLFWDQGLGDM